MENRPDFLEKTRAEMLVLLAYVQAKAGMESESSDSLHRARTMALNFDAMPDYSLKAMRFVENMENSSVFDILGGTASGSIANLISILNDKNFADQWAETAENEQ